MRRWLIVFSACLAIGVALSFATARDTLLWRVFVAIDYLGAPMAGRAEQGPWPWSVPSNWPPPGRLLVNRAWGYERIGALGSVPFRRWPVQEAAPLLLQ